MENSGKAEVITLESLLSSTEAQKSAEEISSSNELEAKLELEKAFKKEDDIFTDLVIGSTEDDIKEDKQKISEVKITEDVEEKEEEIIPIGSKAAGEEQENETESSRLYKKALKDTWGTDEISTIVQIVDGEEVEVNIEDIDLDEETFKLITQAKIEELKEEAIKGKISADGASEFALKLLEIDKNGGEIKDLLRIKTDFLDPLEGLDTSVVEDQREIVYLRNMAAGLDEDSTLRLIKSYEEEGTLSDVAEDSYNKLREAIDKRLEDEVKISQENKKKAEDNFKKYAADLKIELKKFELKDAAKKKIVDFATAIKENGKLAIDEVYNEWRMNPEKSSMLALFMLDEEEFISQLTSKAVRESQLNAAKKLKIIPKSNSNIEVQKTSASNKIVNISQLK
jgi:hypothetical protein